MPYRKLPQTDTGRVRAITALLNAYRIFVVNVTDETKKMKAIDVDTYNRLLTQGTQFLTEVSERGSALSSQSEATTQKTQTLNDLRTVVIHFFLVMNMAIVRGKFHPSIRSSYGLNINEEKLPPMKKEADIFEWSEKIVSAETHRIANGGEPMLNPSLADVQAAQNNYIPLSEDQARKKSNYDKEQEDVSGLRKAIDKLIKDAWNQVEFYFHKDDFPSLRRKARMWGVEYAHRKGETPEPE